MDSIILRRRKKTHFKFKIGDKVRVTNQAIIDNVSKNAGRPANRPDLPYCVGFNKEETYTVKDLGTYVDIDKNEYYKILVEGGTQFVNQNYFIKV